MAREPVKMNSVTSAAGRVSNRAAYMRPGRDNSGSKALASALSSLGGSLDSVNKQVDRYQNAQRQAELEAAQVEQNKKIAQLMVDGQNDGRDGVNRAASLQDSPLFHQAYQEGRMIADYDKTVATMEREVNWKAFSQDVDDGHNKIQQFLLDQGEAMFAGYPPEMQAKMMAKYRDYANKKMVTQSVEAKQIRLENMGEDLITSLESQIEIGASPEELQATMLETATLFAKAGVENPSGAAADALVVATSLTNSPETLTAILEDKEFTKTLSSSARETLMEARDSAVKKKEQLQNAMDAREWEGFREQYGRAVLQAYSVGKENPAAGMEAAAAIREQALAFAHKHPERAPQLLQMADRVEASFLEPATEPLKGAALAEHKIRLRRALSSAATSTEAMEAVMEYERTTGDTSAWATNQMLTWGNEDVKIDTHDAFTSQKGVLVQGTKNIISAMPDAGNSIFDDNDVEYGGNLIRSAAEDVSFTFRRMEADSGLPHNEFVQSVGGYRGIQETYNQLFVSSLATQWDTTNAGEAVSDLNNSEVRAWWRNAERDPQLWAALSLTKDGQTWLAHKEAATGGVDPSAFADD